MTNWTAMLTGAALSGALFFSAAGIQAADIPKSTLAMLQKEKLSVEILKGLDDELKVPAAWISGAKAEGELTVLATWDPGQFTTMTKPFKERYPYIKINYSRASSHERKIKTLLAFKEGRFITDVLSGLGGSFLAFEQAGAVADLRELPNFKILAKEHKDPDGFWVGQRLRYWCMSYNTKLVHKKDLPRTWDDLLTNPRWRNKSIGLSNRPNLWLLMVSGVKGEKWATQYMEKLFKVVRPQVRKEGNNALIGLVIAGEFHAAIPSGAYRVKQYVEKGAPVSFHCPEPVPLAISEMGILKGNPHPNASRLFVNWFLSREGQIAQFHANNAPPVHPALQNERFLAFPKEIVGRPVAFRSPRQLEEDLAVLSKTWNRLWDDISGIKYQTVNAVLDEVQRRGRRITFKVSGKSMTARVSGRRTVLKINGKAARGAELKAGMRCEIIFPGDRQEAKSVSCK